jgi:hypothetical protein
MKDLAKIRKELTEAATASKYAAKKHAEIAEALHSQPGRVPRESIETALLRACVVKADYAKLKAGDAAYWTMLVSGDSLPLTPAMKAELPAVFETGSPTALAVAALMLRDTTLAEELGVPGITASDVADALRESEPKAPNGKGK